MSVGVFAFKRKYEPQNLLPGLGLARETLGGCAMEIAMNLEVEGTNS